MAAIWCSSLVPGNFLKSIGGSGNEVDELHSKVDQWSKYAFQAKDMDFACVVAAGFFALGVFFFALTGVVKVGGSAFKLFTIYGSMSLAITSIPLAAGIDSWKSEKRANDLALDVAKIILRNQERWQKALEKKKEELLNKNKIDKENISLICEGIKKFSGGEDFIKKVEDDHEKAIKGITKEIEKLADLSEKAQAFRLGPSGTEKELSGLNTGK